MIIQINLFSNSVAANCDFHKAELWLLDDSSAGRYYFDMLGRFLALTLIVTLCSCQVSDDPAAENAQTLEAKKRVARNEARMGLAFFYYRLQQQAQEKSRSVQALLGEFASLFKSDELGSSQYEYGVWGPRETLGKSWLSSKALESSLAYLHYEQLGRLLQKKPALPMSSGGWMILAVGNLDKDEELDVWAMGADRELHHLNAD